MKDEDQPEPKPQSSSPPPRPPRGPTVATSFGDDDDEPKRETRINLPPKATVITVRVPAGALKKRPWWKFW